jgi:hypothetical protein
VEVYSDLMDEDGVDNWRGLYKSKKNRFRTISSCYSFTREEMHEMWFMNHAGNKLLKELYPIYAKQLTPAEFGRYCYRILKKLPGFNSIHNYIVDLLNPNTPSRSIKRINNNLRTDVINDFIDYVKPALHSELFLYAEKKNDRVRKTI